MINIAQEYMDAINNGVPTLIAGKVIMADGVFSAVIPMGCFSSTGCSFQSGTTGTNFPIGEAICKVVQLELMGKAELEKDSSNPNSYDGSLVLDHDWMGARLELYLYIQDPNSISGYSEIAKIGYFNVTKAEYIDEILTLTASDDMIRFDIPSMYTTNAAFEWSYGNTFRDICNKCGVGFEEVKGSGIDAIDGKIVKNRPEGFFRNEPEYKDLTCRQILGYIAMISGGNVIINSKGNAEIIKYDTSISATYHDVINWMNYKSGVKDYTVTGIKYIKKIDGENGKTEDEILTIGSYGYMLDVSSNPLLGRKYNSRLDEDGNRYEFAQIYNAINGLTFYSFNCETILNPSIEFMDKIQITDRLGNKRNSYISSLTYNIFGNMMLQNNTNNDAPASNISGGFIGGTNVLGTTSNESDDNATDSDYISLTKLFSGYRDKTVTIAAGSYYGENHASVDELEEYADYESRAFIPVLLTSSSETKTVVPVNVSLIRDAKAMGKYPRLYVSRMPGAETAETVTATVRVYWIEP